MGVDFFISCSSGNRTWAEWIATHLEQAGYTTKHQWADFRPGRSFMEEMQDAAESADRMIAVLSPAYLRSGFCSAEWHAFFARDPTGKAGLIVPVLVEQCDRLGLLSSRVYIDLVGRPEEAARKILLAGVDRNRPRPVTAEFPGEWRGILAEPAARPRRIHPTKRTLWAGVAALLAVAGATGAAVNQPWRRPAPTDDTAQPTSSFSGPATGVGAPITTPSHSGPLASAPLSPGASPPDPDRPSPATSSSPTATATATLPVPPATSRTPAPPGRDPAGTIDIPGDRLADFDRDPPHIEPATAQTEAPAAMDVRVGPDNLYPLNGAQNWFKGSGSCAEERATRGLDGELQLKTEYARRQANPITVCLYTTDHRYYVLDVQTHQDGGGNPYRVTYRLEA